MIPPDPDPQGRYRTLPTGTRRTTVWFGVLGTVLLVLCVPFALPVDRDIVDGDYPSLEDAAVESVLTWSSWSPDLSRLDSRCSAPRTQPGETSVWADCGAVSLEFVGTDGVDTDDGPGAVGRAADRAVRAAWLQDQDSMEFRSEDAAGLVDPSLAPDVPAVMLGGVFGYTYDGDSPTGDDDGFVDPDDVGSFGGGLNDVSVSRVADTAAHPATHPAAVTAGDPVAEGIPFWVQAGALVGPGDTMYTLIVSGADPDRVSSSLTGMIGELR